MTNRRFTYSAVTACALLLTGILLLVNCRQMWTAVAHPIEDAYITFRYATQIVRGHGPVFNPDEPVEGYSNPVWLLLLAGAEHAGADLEHVSRLLGSLCHVATWLVLAAGALRTTNRHPACGLLAPVLYLCYLPALFYSVSGLETPLFGLELVLAVVLLTTDRHPARTRPAGALCLLAAALTRPEGIAYALCWCGLTLCDRRDRSRAAAVGMGLIAAGYALFLLWRIGFYHQLVPNTMPAKSFLPLYQRVALGLWQIRDWTLHYLPLTAALAAVLWFSRRHWHARIRLTVAFLGCGIGFVVCFAPFDWMPFYRYLVPLWPLAVLCMQDGLCALARTTPAAFRGRPALLAVVLALAWTVGLIETNRADQALLGQWARIDATAYGNNRRVAEWIRAHLPPEAVIATGDVGRFGYFSDARIVDLLGLTDRAFARLRRHRGRPDVDLATCTIDFSRCKAAEREMLLDRRPDYVLLYSLDSTICETFFGSAGGIADTPAFARHYTFMTTLPYGPPLAVHAWPRRRYFIAPTDTASGILAWVTGLWGCHIYRRNDSPAPAFTINVDHRWRVTRISNP